MTPKQLLARAAVFLNAGNALPVDLYIALTSAGIDAATLEAEWVVENEDALPCERIDCGMCRHGLCKTCTTDCPECHAASMG